MLAAITRGFRDLLADRGELTDGVTVRSMVPVSVRRRDRERHPGQPGLRGVRGPAGGRAGPAARLAALRRQMDELKKPPDALDARTIIGLADFVAPTLLALGTRAGFRTGSRWSRP